MKRYSLWLTASVALMSPPAAAADAAREVESLAVNVDNSIQACGMHATSSEREKGSFLEKHGFKLTDTAPPTIVALNSPSTMGTSRYLRWLDPHAEIWLIASISKPTCRIAVSNSQWADQIGPRLDQLVQVGNFWRPARLGENGLAGGEDAVSTRSVYFMDTPDASQVRPTLLIIAAKPGQSVLGQKLIITVLMVSKQQL